MHGATGWRTPARPFPRTPLYRVVDRDGKTIWSGDCANCARMIAAGSPEWRVDAKH